MKKLLISCLLCILAFTPVLVGCSNVPPLENAPKSSAKNIIYGSALTFEDYLYFANSHKSSDTLEKGDNKNNAGNASIYRIALNEEGAIELDDKNNPKNHEKVLEKIAGHENGFMFSHGEYIYFASPNVHLDDTLSTLFTYNSYFRVKTDGTGLKEFYSSSTTVSQQTVVTIDGELYLIIADADASGNKLVKISLTEDLGKTTVLASGYSSVIFAEKMIHENDKYAYYVTDLSETETAQGKTGNYINRVDITTGEKLEKVNANRAQDITLKKVYNGSLYFVTAEKNQEINLNSVFARMDNFATFSYTELTTPLSNITNYTDFTIILDETNHYHYLITVNSKTYALPENDTYLADHLLFEGGTVLFAYADYVYYTTSDGIFRSNVRDASDKTQLSTLISLKTENVAFDGTYIYYYADDSTSTGTYYLYRTRVDINSANHELLSLMQEEDIEKANEDKNDNSDSEDSE